ncbi:carbohydrate-binding family 9-like protein [Halopiger xanaduensis]|nr:carbohydrate-binding family 9-like protein [Halopiger xanaduensis]
MKTYTIARATDDVPLTGAIEGTVWEDVPAVDLEEFTWHDGGSDPKLTTTARVCYDERALFLQFHAEDDDITASVTELNGPTFEDSSVELFADPTPDADSRYFNFEPNCCGQFKLAWQEAGWEERGIGRTLIDPDLAERIDVRTSVPGPTKESRPDDEDWWLAARIPFDVLSDVTGLEIRPTSGTEWRGNFYRSGLPDHQKSTWNPIEKATPDYHSPEYFGRLRFE